jgi:hypothetical protein
MQQVRIHLGAKDGVCQFQLANLFAIQIHYVNYRHDFFSFSIPKTSFAASQALETIWPTSPCG